MDHAFYLPLVLIGLTVLIFAGCWRFPGFRMLFDDSACALCLGPARTALTAITGFYLPSPCWA
jgi:hypothetical protein